MQLCIRVQQKTHAVFEKNIMKVWNLYMLRVICTLVFVNGHTVLNRIRNLPLPSVSHLDLSCLVQLSKIPRGMSIYYFPSNI